MAVKSFPGKQWGNDQSNANDEPDWRYVEEDPTHGGYAAAGHSPDLSLTGNVAANIVATVSGWQLVFPDASVGNPTVPASNTGVLETLVAIGGLKMPPLTALFLQDMTDATDNVGTGNLVVRVQMSSGVDVRTSNAANVYIVAIGDTGSVANANLVYDASLSAPGSGVLVFKKENADLTGYSGNDTLTINSTSEFHGSVTVLSRKKKGPTQNVIATPLSTMTGANAVVITIT
jgi:hypothetical protein